MGLFEKLFGNNRKADTQTHTNAMIAPMIAIILVDGKVSAARRSVVERRLFQLGGDGSARHAIRRRCRCLAPCLRSRSSRRCRIDTSRSRFQKCYGRTFDFTADC